MYLFIYMTIPIYVDIYVYIIYTGVCALVHVTINVSYFDYIIFYMY